MLALSKRGVDVGIVIANVAAQKTFYGDVLGLPFVREVPLPNGAVHIFACGESLLKLYALKGANADQGLGEFGSRLGLGYVTLPLSNIEEVVEGCERAGVKFLTPLSDFESGTRGSLGAVKARFAMIADPEGNRIELFQRLS